jgi:hypothetical protein
MEATMMSDKGKRNIRFSPRELRFLELYFSGYLMKDAVKAAGYGGASDQALCNTGRAILNKYEKSAAAKGGFRGVGISEGQIVQLLLGAVQNQTESKKVKYLTTLANAMFSRR